MEVKIIPHHKQRYNTCGDYYTKGDITQFRVSRMKDKDYELLVLIHEIIEQYLVSKHKISEKSIDQFDMQFEKERIEHKHAFDDEPGDDESAPYYHEHQTATFIEQQLAEAIGVDWKEYNNIVNNL